MANEQLHAAKTAKNDEFYTQYEDIECEINSYIEYNKDVFRDKTILCPCDDPEWSNFTKYFAANFERFGLKKLICTSYAKGIGNEQITSFELSSPNFNEGLHKTHGKIFVLENDKKTSRQINYKDIKFEYLDGDGDFRSDEVKKLRDEADIIITNPPFSQFRCFLNWILEANKKFIIIGNKNSISMSDVFPLFMENKIWVGHRSMNSDFWLRVPEGAKYEKIVNGVKLKHIMACWYTNLEHNKRHEDLQLMTMNDNLKYNKKLIKKLSSVFGKREYPKYDNYDAIEIPIVEAIPSDYFGVMGVPVTFMDKYNPKQFEILGCTQRGCHDKFPDTKKYNDYYEVKQDGSRTGSSGNKTNENANIANNDGVHNYFINNEGHVVQSTYSRIFIRRRDI